MVDAFINGRTVNQPMIVFFAVIESLFNVFSNDTKVVKKYEFLV